MHQVFDRTLLFLLEESCYEALGRFNGPHDVSGANARNKKQEFVEISV